MHIFAHLRYGDDRRKWCAFVCNFGAQNRPKKMLYIDSQIIKRCVCVGGGGGGEVVYVTN